MKDFFIAALITSEEINIPKPNGGNDSGLLSTILFTVYFWAAVIAVIVIVVAGFMYTTSAGDAGRVSRAKSAIIGAVLGLVFVLMAFSITTIVLGGFK